MGFEKWFWIQVDTGLGQEHRAAIGLQSQIGDRGSPIPGEFVAF